MTEYLAYAAFTHHGNHSPQNQDAILVEGQVWQKAAFVSGCVPLMAMPRFAISDGVGGVARNRRPPVDDFCKNYWHWMPATQPSRPGAG
jgi:hypothetical protein